MNGFDLFALPKFSLSVTSHSEAALRYFDFYQINFSQEFDNLSHHFGYRVIDKFSIACHFFKPAEAKATVIINHGYMDHAGLYQHLIRFLLQNNYAVFIYDHPGHGLSTGQTAGIESFADYQTVLCSHLDFLNAHDVFPSIMIGQSMGGAISSDCVLHKSNPHIKKLVLLAPLVIPWQWDLITKQLLVLKHFVDSVPRKFKKNSLDDQFVNFLHFEDPLQTRKITTSWVKALNEWQAHIHSSPVSDIPCLLLQGDNDETVDWPYNLGVYKVKFSALEVEMLASAKHHLVCEIESIREPFLFKPMLSFLEQ